VSTGDNLWTVNLVVEDDTDGRALRDLVQASRIPISVDWLPGNGIGNIKRKGTALIDLARSRIKNGKGCVAVLVDRDGNDSGRREPHRTIRRTCRQAGAAYVEAVEAFEAWCLADPGISAWLGLVQKAKVESIADPKAKVAAAFARKTGRHYGRRRSRRQLVAHATGVAATLSSSWTAALALLGACATPHPNRGQMDRPTGPETAHR